MGAGKTPPPVVVHGQHRRGIPGERVGTDDNDLGTVRVVFTAAGSPERNAEADRSAMATRPR